MEVPVDAGSNGGGAFALIYLFFLVLLGLPVMVFSLERASQASPVGLYQRLQKPHQKWHIHGYSTLVANLLLVMFYTSVTGWGFDNFLKEANIGKGLKLKRWMKPYMTYVLPTFIVIIFFIGIISF